MFMVKSLIELRMNMVDTYVPQTHLFLALNTNRYLTERIIFLISSFQLHRIRRYKLTLHEIWTSILLLLRTIHVDGEHVFFGQFYINRNIKLKL